MKLLATILSIHILFLTVTPAFPKMTSTAVKKMDCKKSCCSNEHDTKKTTNTDCCNICNPFMVCCNCSAVVSQKQNISAPVSFSNEKHFSIISENGCDYSAEAWNPPKTV